jgi:isocitrate dehydrogenase kinase/phosphatase
VDKPSQQVEKARLEKAYSHLISSARDDGRIAATARLILAIFDEFYARLCEYPFRAKLAFETMDTHVSIEISHQRLGLYSRYISEHGPRIVAAFPALANNEAIWDTLDRLFVAMIVDRYISTAEQAPGSFHGCGSSPAGGE